MLQLQLKLPSGRLLTIANLVRFNAKTGSSSFHYLAGNHKQQICQPPVLKISRANHCQRPKLPPVSITSPGVYHSKAPVPRNGPYQRWHPDTIVDRNCNDMRRLINRLIDSRASNVTQFCENIGVNKSSFYRFMGHTGTWEGKRSDTFSLGLHYFQNREKEGLKIPRKVPSKAKAKSKSKSPAVVTLEGEQEDKVPVYDNCDVVRRKISAHMRHVTQAAFLKDLSTQFHTIPTKIKPSDLEKFRGGKGPNSGNANPVFYAAYVFFEKIRIGAGKEKSKDREEMEKIYQVSGGVNVKVPSDKYGAWLGTLPPNSYVWLNKYGIATVHTRGTGTTRYGPPGPIPNLYADAYEFYTYD